MIVIKMIVIIMKNRSIIVMNINLYQLFIFLVQHDISNCLLIILLTFHFISFSICIILLTFHFISFLFIFNMYNITHISFHFIFNMYNITYIFISHRFCFMINEILAPSFLVILFLLPCTRYR